MRKTLPRWLSIALTVALVAVLAGCGGEMGDSSGAPAPDGGGDSQSFGDSRKIVRTTELDLAIKDLDSALDDIRSLAVESGGFVSNSNIVVSNSEDPQVARPESSIVTIRVPVDQYEEVMARLRGISAGVDSEHTSTREVTGEYTDLQSRLSNLQKSETAFVALLERAESIDEILRVQQQVNETRGQIEQVQGQLNVLNDQADLATITITLRLTATSVSHGNWAARTFEGSWDASEAMAVALGTFAIAGAFATAWLIPPGLVAFFIWRRFGDRIRGLAKKLG